MASSTMFMVSLDHSPGEQLFDDSAWQTSAIVASEGGEHFRLAEDLARALGKNDGYPKKWSSRPGKYQRQFEGSFSSLLSQHPIHVRAASSLGRLIRGLAPTFVEELGIQGAFSTVHKNGKEYARFGPFFRQAPSTGSLDSFELPLRQGLHLLFILWFTCRSHWSVLGVVQKERPDVDWIDWQIIPNKFPGGIEGPMALAYSTLLSVVAHRGIVRGTLRTSTLVETRADVGSALADNIAGLLTDKLERESRDLVVPQPQGKGSSFLWDILDEKISPASPSSG